MRLNQLGIKGWEEIVREADHTRPYPGAKDVADHYWFEERIMVRLWEDGSLMAARIHVSKVGNLYLKFNYRGSGQASNCAQIAYKNYLANKVLLE